jgi:hypothetical protein
MCNFLPIHCFCKKIAASGEGQDCETGMKAYSLYDNPIKTLALLTLTPAIHSYVYIPLFSSTVTSHSSSLGRYVFGSEISYNKPPPRLPGLGC